jgi:DNA-binding GntR family transcriptional regulator
MPVKGRSRPVGRDGGRESLSATEQAYRAIKRGILSNKLKAGEPVPSDRFVRELGVSRTPVREAMLRLEREGLIDIRPRMGTFVSHLNVGQIREMYDVRRLLEGQAARLAAVRPSQQELARVGRELRACNPEVLGDCRRMSDAGQLLHGYIREHCGNETLTAMLRSLDDHFTRFRSLSLSMPDKIRSSHGEHLAILDALDAADPDRAERLTRSHFEHAAQFLLDSILGAPQAHQMTVAGPR